MVDVLKKQNPLRKWRLSEEEYNYVLLPKIINRWSDKRLSALYKIVVLGVKQIEIANELGVPRSNVNKMLKTAYGIYRESVVSTLIIGR